MPLAAATKMTLSHFQRIINPFDSHRSSGESALRAAVEITPERRPLHRTRLDDGDVFWMAAYAVLHLQMDFLRARELACRSLELLSCSSPA
jgi:hypothetical protein